MYLLIAYRHNTSFHSSWPKGRLLDLPNSVRIHTKQPIRYFNYTQLIPALTCSNAQLIILRIHVRKGWDSHLKNPVPKKQYDNTIHLQGKYLQKDTLSYLATWILLISSFPDWSVYLLARHFSALTE